MESRDMNKQHRRSLGLRAALAILAALCSIAAAGQQQQGRRLLGPSFGSAEDDPTL